VATRRRTLCIAVCCVSTAGTVVGVVLQAREAEAASSRWSIIPSTPRLNPGSVGDFLAGVSCTNATRCMAVGYDTSGNGRVATLIESWNGKAWSVTRSRSRASIGNVLSGVSCTSPRRCVAVGYYENGNEPRPTLVESWNGKAWSVTPSPNPTGRADNTFDGVSCTSATSCVAVGHYWFNSFNSPGSQTLALAWNGAAWSIAYTPTFDAVLNSVSCTSPTSCVAVGSPGVQIETWNGTTWSVAHNPGDNGNSLHGVSCASSGNCVAVGYSAKGSASQTLIMTGYSSPMITKT
jgi:hypothetical protein